MRAGLSLAEPYFYFSSDRLRQRWSQRITRLPGEGPRGSQLLEKSDQLVSWCPAVLWNPSILLVLVEHARISCRVQVRLQWISEA
jgi:hypothetical protein